MLYNSGNTNFMNSLILLAFIEYPALGPLCLSWVSLHKSFHLSLPQFPHLYNESKTGIYIWDYVSLKQLEHIKCLPPCLVHSICSRNAGYYQVYS